MLSSPALAAMGIAMSRTSVERPGCEENCGELTAGFAAAGRKQRDGFSVELGLAYQEAGGNGDAHPTVLENVDGEIGAARGEFAVHVEFVVDARERGFDGRRFGLAFGRIGFGAESLVFVETDDTQPGPGGREESCCAGCRTAASKRRCDKGNRETLRERSSWNQKNPRVDHVCVLDSVRFVSTNLDTRTARA
jgi:hypothetical protein